ncbi:hypothetical protein [Baekduia sp. Peel2402]|uniref:hypothetical protein n=1 Tax=Baekduia sp. Peel2402 TaxID=3458296 RepID=UPI00403E50AA
MPVTDLPIGRRDLDGATITGVGRTLYVSAVTRSAQAKDASRLLTFIRRGDRWQTVPALTVDRGSGFQAAGFGGTLCVGYTAHGEPEFACLRDRRWQRGPGLPSRSSADNRFALSRLVASRGGLLAVLEEQRDRHLTEGGVGIAGRLVPSLFRLEGGRWRPVTSRQVDGATAGNTRANPIALDGRSCMAYTALPQIAPGATATSPTVKVRCAGGEGWSDLGAALTSPQVDPNKLFIELDDAIADGASVFAGVLAHGETDSDWHVMRLHDGTWTSTPLAGTDPLALEQGTLYSTSEGPVAIRFAQPRGKSGVQGELTAWRLTDDGSTASMIGRPLFPRRSIKAPIYYGIAQADRTTFAMVTRPIFTRGKSDIRVYELRKDSADTGSERHGSR